ncbi:hypothetical protein SMC26_40015 [Actinomadura fulvescens]|uniref:Secreted protein n=1 Tax=Actinomadura fulvescens TaxID=46160 RepID=A0ABN3Q8L4_9ACTN
MFKRTVAFAAAAASVMAVNVAVAPSANAGGYGCAGNLVRSIPVPMKDRLTGKTYYRSDVKLYYNPKSGWNCAALVKRPGKPRYNDRTPMYIQIYNSRYAEDRAKGNVATDQGNFKRYAGPVKVRGRWKGKGLCISVYALHADHRADGDRPDYNGRLYKTRLACR